MRILVVNPNTSPSMTATIEAVGRRLSHPGFEVVTRRADFGPVGIDTQVDDVVAAFATLEVIARERTAFDAFVIACYDDPALEACREIASGPVLGIGETSMLVACALSGKFSVVCCSPEEIPTTEAVVARYGLASRCASVRSAGMSVTDDLTGAVAIEKMEAAARRAIVEDGARAVCLGCAGLAAVRSPLEKRLSVPVVDGVEAAIRMAGLLAAMRTPASARPVPGSATGKGFTPLEGARLPGIQSIYG
ncbi:MAG: aspartate/glutamate racemase family protein [Firmicutes bacterium]|jgi:allantoin racemase|nr:aspartate/glutamate racemase family protein [Bacillota bacterium]